MTPRCKGTAHVASFSWGKHLYEKKQKCQCGQIEIEFIRPNVMRIYSSMAETKITVSIGG